MKTVTFNIRYDIIGKLDGRWIIKAFDSNDNQIGVTIEVRTPDEAYKIFMMLNGYTCEPVNVISNEETLSDEIELDDKTKEVA